MRPLVEPAFSWAVAGYFVLLPCCAADELMPLQGPGRHADHSSADVHAAGAVNHGDRPGLQHHLCTIAWHYGVVPSDDRCNSTSKLGVRRPHAAQACANFQAVSAQGMIYTQGRPGPMFMQPGLQHAARVGQPVFMQPAQTPAAPRCRILRCCNALGHYRGHTFIHHLSAAIHPTDSRSDADPAGTRARWTRRALWSLTTQPRCRTDWRRVDGRLVWVPPER